MNCSIIGNKIKDLRQAVDITQGELADGICTQALISRMEKGDIYPMLLLSIRFPINLEWM